MPRFKATLAAPWVWLIHDTTKTPWHLVATLDWRQDDMGNPIGLEVMAQRIAALLNDNEERPRAESWL